MDGTLCHFPFNYGGVVYEECTKADSDVYWCATSPEYSYDNYGTCDSKCPMERGKYISIIWGLYGLAWYYV